VHGLHPQAAALITAAGGGSGTAVSAQQRGEPAQRAQAPVAAVAQVGMQPFGAADPFVPSLPQPVLVRAEQARPDQAGAGDQLAGGRGVAADRQVVPQVPPVGGLDGQRGALAAPSNGTVGYQNCPMPAADTRESDDRDVSCAA